MKVQKYWNSSSSICQITDSCLPVLVTVLLFQVLWGFQTYISKFSFQQLGEPGLQNLSLASSQRIWSIRESSNTGSGKDLHTSFSFARAQAAKAWPRAKGCTERWGWVKMVWWRAVKDSRFKCLLWLNWFIPSSGTLQTSPMALFKLPASPYFLLPTD